MNQFFEDLPRDLYLLDLPQPMAGFNRFVSSWFFVDSMERRVVVDPGPANTIPALLQELSSVTDGLDLVLLTHIHLDHSGGVGQLCERYDGAKVAAHRKAGRHLSNPEKLWKASLSVLGNIAEMYGEPKPIAPEKLIDCEELAGVEIFKTPGHAPHHISFIVPFQGQRLFFIGEAAGLRLPMEFGTRYLRPTTPPIFDVAAARESLAKIESAVRGDELLCYSHWGATRDSKTQIAAAREQLDEWLDVISGKEDRPIAEIAEYLISNDPFLAGYSGLPADIRSRERLFIENSVKGFVEYLQERPN